jgi:hypothetical protein
MTTMHNYSRTNTLFLSLALFLLIFFSCSEEPEKVLPVNASMISIGDLPDSKSDDANARKGGPDNSQPVYSFADPASEIQGSSTAIMRNPNGISMNFQVTDAVAGHAYTVWWVIFNAPENCATTPCSEPDIFNLDTQTDVTFAAGTIVGANGLSVSGHRSVGDLSGSAMPFFNDVLGLDLPVVGLIDPEGAEVHLVTRSHGPKVPGEMPDQINSYVGGCYNFLQPPDQAVNEGDCADTHFSIHLPG